MLRKRLYVYLFRSTRLRRQGQGNRQPQRDSLFSATTTVSQRQHNAQDYTCLQPIYTPPTWFIMTSVRIENLDHETLASILDTLIQERLDGFRGISIIRFGEIKLACNWLEILSKNFSPFKQGLLK